MKMEDSQRDEEKLGAHSTQDLERPYGAESPVDLGYAQEMVRNRSMMTLLFQSLAIAAIPYGEGSPLISAIYGGGQLSIFIGWIAVCVLDQCIAMSLSELASRYPTSAGPAYWAFQISKRGKVLLSFVTGWLWLIGNWTITLSVNFGFASLVAGTVGMFHPNYNATSWELLLIFYGITLLTMLICIFGNRFLPSVDTVCAAWTLLSIIAILIALSVKADVGRHSVSDALTYYNTSYAGWGGFTFFIGLLPAAYTFSAIGMIASMAEEVAHPATQVPKAISLCIPIGGTAGLFFILPICFTLPPLAGILEAPAAQALPYIFHMVMGSPGGGLGLMVLVFGVTLFCSISITTAASRCTWAFARDKAIPFSSPLSKVNERLGVPVNALIVVTIVQLLLGLIELGSTSAFDAFVSVGVMALAVSYLVPIVVSMLHARQEVAQAQWHLPSTLGWIVNGIAVAWIAFETVLFSMPTALPVTEVSMNYASVVLIGFGALAAVWYMVHARHIYAGPPAAGHV